MLVLVSYTEGRLLPIYLAICITCLASAPYIDTFDTEHGSIPLHQMRMGLHPLLELERVHHIYELYDERTVLVLLFECDVYPQTDGRVSHQRGLQNNRIRR